MKDSIFLVIAAAASMATFYLWPVYEESKANQVCSELHCAIGVACDAPIPHERTRKA